MQEDFHYYATLSAALLAGYSFEESLAVAWSAQFTDCCSRTFLKKVGAPASAATTQTQMELADAPTDLTGLQDITRIWASFHFLPADLYAAGRKRARHYNYRYRLICGPNGPLAEKTVKLAKLGGLQAAGLAMHVLADTWAHRYFAGTPSLVINNTDFYFYELRDGDDVSGGRQVTFRHSPGLKDDPEKGIYVSTVFQGNENSVMNLGHGRAGHLPDYSFMRYRYLPAWGRYDEIVKDNPADYRSAYCQMIYALKCLKENGPDFETGCYDEEMVAPYSDEIEAILRKRQLSASADWKAFAEKLSGREIPDFDAEQYSEEYRTAAAEEKDETFLGRFFLAALAQKSMVTGNIFRSKNPLAGLAVDYDRKGLKGIRDFFRIAKYLRKERKHG